MRGRIRIPVDELTWEPAVLVLPHGDALFVFALPE
jgi:hypothetical protein